MTAAKLVIFILVITISSCDPAKLIILKNKSHKPVRVTWIMENDSTSNNAKFSRHVTATFNLGTKRSEREKTLAFGFGNWPEYEIERFVNEDVRSIQIEGSGPTIIMTNKEEMKSFLLARRHGLFKNFITIKIQ